MYPQDLGGVSRGTFQYFCPFLVKHKIHQDIINRLSGKTCIYKLDIFIRRKIKFFFLRRCPLQAVFQKLAVTVSVLFILIIRDDQAIFSNAFFQVGDLYLTFLSGFCPVCGIRVRWILKNSEMETVFLFCMKTVSTFSTMVYSERHLNQKLVFRNLLGIIAADLQESIYIRGYGL